MTKRKGSKRKRGTGGSGTSTGMQSRSTWWFLRIAPVVIVAGAVALYFGAGSSQGAAIVMVLGLIIWLAVALGNLGAQVPPRDRTRPSAIEFGKPSNPNQKS